MIKKSFGKCIYIYFFFFFTHRHYNMQNHQIYNLYQQTVSPDISSYVNKQINIHDIFHVPCLYWYLSLKLPYNKALLFNPN